MKEVASGPDMKIVEDRNLRSIEAIMGSGRRPKCIACGEDIADEPCLMLFAMNDLAVTDLIATVAMHPKCMEGLGNEDRMFTVESNVIRVNMMRSMVQASELGQLGIDTESPVC